MRVNKTTFKKNWSKKIKINKNKKNWSFVDSVMKWNKPVHGKTEDLVLFQIANLCEPKSYHLGEEKQESY